MQGVLVSLDLETTGLDWDAQIIEIGAVKVVDGQITDNFSTLVNPGKPIPPIVANLTGIRNEDVSLAPRLPDVLPKLVEFVGDAIILGQNIDFDLKFLHREKLFKENPTLDTYELASVLLPTAPRYGLGALMDTLGLTPEGQYHRALADANATVQVFNVLYQRLIDTLPYPLIQEILGYAQGFPWQGLLAFKAAAIELEAQGARSMPAMPPLFTTPPPPNASVIRSGLGGQIPDTDRTVQVQAVMRSALHEGGTVLIEADTVTDTIRAAHREAAAFAGGQVVIVTPRLEDQADQVRDSGAAVVYGRNFYLCPSRLRALQRRGATSLDELRVLAKLLIWLHLDSEADGVRGTVSIRGPGEFTAWDHLSAQDEQCNLDRCTRVNGGVCPFYQACMTAMNAPIVAADQGLLLRDLAERQANVQGTAVTPVIPSLERVIVTGTELLESISGDVLSTQLEAAVIRARLADFTSKKAGLLGDVVRTGQTFLSAGNAAQLEQFTLNLSQSVKGLSKHVERLFTALAEFMRGGRKESDLGNPVKLTAESLRSANFAPVTEAWSITDEFAGSVAAAMERLSGQLGKLNAERVRDLDDLVEGTRAAGRYLSGLQKVLRGALSQPESGYSYWLELSRDGARLTLNAAPYEIAGLLQTQLYSRARTVVMTGNALRTPDSLDFTRARLGLTDPARTVDIQVIAPPPPVSTSADDQQTTASALLLMPSDMPDSNERDANQRAMERTIIGLCGVNKRKALILFTGYGALNNVAGSITARLGLGKVTVYNQAEGSSYRNSLNEFRAARHGVWLGIRPAWDSPSFVFTADEVDLLIITRLPFGIASDPIVSSRAAQSKDSFTAYTLPDAVQKFRMAINRIIPTGRRTVIAVLDKRMTGKDYGKAFIAGVPGAKAQPTTLDQIVADAGGWLEGQPNG